MNLYTEAGWLNAPHIEEVADRNNISFIVIIGKRQIGKTYNVLKLMLDSDKRFILLRSVLAEFDMLKKNVNSPFEKIKEYEKRVIFSAETQYTAGILRQDENEDGDIVNINIGMLSALSAIGRIRGFNGDMYSDVVYDEFIPESHLLKVRGGGDAFLNMYTTVSGNRELEGRKPLRVWLLANSNNLDNDILDALNITDIVERMSLRGEEFRMLKDRGIMIILPDSTKVIEQRKKGALYRAVGGDSKFAKMAYGNEFSYNDYTDVGQPPIKEYNLLLTVGAISVFLHKSYRLLYITTKSKQAPRHIYGESDYGFRTFMKEYPEIKAMYMRGKILFQSMTVKNYFLNIVEKF